MKVHEITMDIAIELAKLQWGTANDIELNSDPDDGMTIISSDGEEYERDVLCITQEGGLWVEDVQTHQTNTPKREVFDFLVKHKVEPWK